MIVLRSAGLLFGLIGVMAISAMNPALAEYDKPYVGDQKIYIADEEDTLVHIARRYGLGFVEMRAANPNVDPWIPGEGKELVLPSRHLLPEAPHSGIVINLPEMRLYAFLNGENAEPETYSLGIGREGLETPLGQTTVVSKKDGPTWRPTARMLREDPTLDAVVPPGPDNPLGTHALYLGWPQYRIHGTNKPYGIGRRSSSGCLRLYPENITELFDITPVGTRVTVVNQPIKLAWIDDVLYMEAHPDMAQAIQMEETGQIYAAKMSDQDMALIVAAAGEQQNRLHWATIRNEIRNRSGFPVVIARKEGAKLSEADFEVIDGRKVKLSAQEAAEVEAIEPPDFVAEDAAAPGETGQVSESAATGPEILEETAPAHEETAPAEDLPVQDSVPEDAPAEQIEGSGDEESDQPATKSDVNP